jgi:hypothetical protein
LNIPAEGVDLSAHSISGSPVDGGFVVPYFNEMDVELPGTIPKIGSV